MSTPAEMMGMPLGVEDDYLIPGQDSTQVETPLEPEEPEIRGEVIDWKGGKPVDLKKKLKSGKTVREELSSHVKITLAEKRGARPKPWMADVSIPVARKISDSIFVRIQDMVWNKIRVFLFRPRGIATAEMNDKFQIWEKAFNNYCKNDLNLKEKMRFPTRQAVNSGTGVVKIVYETKNKTIYRYSSPEEQYDSAVKKYRLPGTKDTVVKEQAIVFRGPNVYPVDRAKFVISSDALTLEEAYLTGFSFERRKKQLQTLAANGIYDKEGVDKLTATEPSELDQMRAISEGKELKKGQYTEPYQLWELWFRYDVDDDGEEDDIVVTFHRESGQIVKAIYNPIFYGYRPFADFKAASQTEYTYDGEGIIEIIGVMSEELDTLHNLMLDRMKLINLPIIFARSGIGLDNYELEPGKIKVIDDDPEKAIFVVPMPDVTFSLVNEINWLIGQMDLVCGITPGALGVSTAERPVAKESMLMAEEFNKKFKAWTDRAREFYRETAYKLLEAFSQYQPTYEYTDENGNLQSVEMPTGNIRDYLDLDLAVSSEEWNMTTRREVELMKYQLLSDYMTKMAGMVQMLTSPQVPSEFKKFLALANDVSSRAVEKVMSNFEDTEPESTVVDIRKVVDVEKCIMMSADLIAQQQAMAGGPPGQGAMGQPPPPGAMGQPGMPPQ